MYMSFKQAEIPVGPNYIWVDRQNRGLVVGRMAKTALSNILSRGNATLRTEFLMCDPNHRLGVLAMNKQEEKRITRMLDPTLIPSEVNPKVEEIREIVAINRTNRFRGLGLEPRAMLVGPIVLGEVVDWSRKSIEDGLPVTAHGLTVLEHAFAEFDHIIEAKE